MIIAAVTEWCSNVKVAKDLSESQVIKAGSQT